MPKRSFKKETARDNRGSRKYRSKSDTTKRPKPRTSKQYWMPARKVYGKTIPGHWCKNPHYRPRR